MDRLMISNPKFLGCSNSVPVSQKRGQNELNLARIHGKTNKGARIKNLTSNTLSSALVTRSQLHGGEQSSQMNSSSVPMQIFIEIMYDGRRFPLMVKSSDTVLSVKKKIYDEVGMPVHQQRLFFAGKVIENHQTLANYNIQEKSTIDTSVFHVGYRCMAD